MKRLCDICFAAMGLFVLSPVYLLVAVGVKLTSAGPVFFRQDRLGLHGTHFSIFKFRSMWVHPRGSGCQVTAGGDCRITTFGGFLRRTKLDELPQLINVLRGDMSFVGPRPEVPEFAELFPMEYARILKVRPGITHRATLVFRREEDILAEVQDPRGFYIENLMPEKLAAYESHLEQSVAQDIRTIIETILPYWSEKPLSLEHFTAKPVLLRAAATVDQAVTDYWPQATAVENIPAFAGEIVPENQSEFDRVATAGR